MKPLIFKTNSSSEIEMLEMFFKSHKSTKVLDDFTEQLKELFFTKNPSLSINAQEGEHAFKNHLKKLTVKSPLKYQGSWVYYPWLNSICHVLNEEDFFIVRTSRNQNLIYPSEQKKFYNLKVGIGGLSIGSSVAIALVLQGGAKNLKLADFDNLALSNTNRIHAGVHNLGESKIEILIKQIYEINPYQKIEIFSQGLNKKNISKFINNLDVVIDELDNFLAKIYLRVEARKQKKPILMGADVGNSAIIDVERYDKKPQLQYFNGRLGKINPEAFAKLTKKETGKYIAKLLGKENHEKRMLESLSEIGKNIVSWPQLGGTAILNASAIAYLVRKISVNEQINKNRYIINLNELLS